MNQYILLVHNNADGDSTSKEWDAFFDAAGESGYFRGGSEIAEGELIGNSEVAKLSRKMGGYMRFDCEDKGQLLELLKLHPVVVHGGTVELCEMPESG